MEPGGSAVPAIFGLIWRRQWVLYVTLILTLSAAFMYYASVGERYEAYTLLRVGHGINDGSTKVPFADSADLLGRMDSLARIGRTDHVIQEAARQVGYERLFPEAKATLISKHRPAVLANFRAWVWGADQEVGYSKGSATEAAAHDALDQAIENHKSDIAKLRDRLLAKQEGRSDLLRVSFRHSDPVTAAEYVNTLANVLVGTHGALGQVPGALEFFQQQSKRLEQEAERAADDLQKFSVKAAIYAIDEQRELLLKRANELTNLISSTHGVIEERKGQKQAIVDQLLVLRPVTQSNTVTRIVKTLSGSGVRPAAEGAPSQLGGFDEAPPLLLVKAYQDNMSALLKVNADLSGSTRLLDHRVTELAEVRKELASLSKMEAEYERLKRILATASSAAQHYQRRMIEEQINAEIAKKTQLGSLRIVQRATSPTAPVFPRLLQVIGLAVIGGILLGCAIIVGPLLARGSTPHRNSEPEEHTHKALGAAPMRLRA